MRRKITVALLSLAMVLSMLPMSAVAADNVTLDITVRDFKADGLLFEGEIYDGEGLVQKTLGTDKKPVFVLARWQEIYGSAVTQDMLKSFFNDVTGKNMRTEKELTMSAAQEAGYYEINSDIDAQGNPASGFFPIDNELFGNEGNEHNFHFSVEVHTRFKYVQGATFEFNGDDDFWIFFNGQLVLDLGGVHSNIGGSVSVDELAGQLGIKPGDTITFDMFYMERHLDGSNLRMKTNFEFLNLQASAWATENLQKASDMGLIPDVLMTADLTKSITRAEFAAVCVKTYENLSGLKAIPAVVNPFKDTADVEVLKAYNTGLMAGVSADKFDPDKILNREQAATALTNVFKRVAIPNWQSGVSYTLNFTMPAKFSDDDKISSWAKDPVYFMVSNGIISGMGNNTFAPRNTTTAQEAQHYADATREQALVIAVKMVENLKGKAADYTAK